LVYCLPALALLTAAGLAAVTRLAMLTPLGKAAWLPAALIVVLLVALVLGPQRLMRLPSALPDNLRRVAAIVAAYGRPGDAVLYLPASLQPGLPGPVPAAAGYRAGRIAGRRGQPDRHPGAAGHPAV